MSEIRTICPECGRKKLYINSEKLLGFCHRCDTAFGTFKCEELIAGIKPVERKIVTPKEIQRRISPWRDVRARTYLKDRLVTPEDDPHIEYDQYNRRLYFRIWSPSPKDNPPAFHTRGLTKEDGWRCTPGVDKRNYFYGRVHKNATRICLVEGIFDAIRVGNDTVALLGTHLSDTHLVYLKKFNRVLIWLDPDEAGFLAAEKIMDQLRSEGILYTYMYNISEPGDLFPGHEWIEWAQKWLQEGIKDG